MPFHHPLGASLIIGAMVKLDALYCLGAGGFALLKGRADSPHGQDGLSSTYKKSLREIADFKQPKSAPATSWS